MKLKTIRKWCAAGALVALAGCGGGQNTEGNGNMAAGGGNAEGGTTATNLTGEIKGDGSSTVFPITEAVVEDFGKQQRNVRVTVGESGTGGGFQKFIAGEIVLANASRPIKENEAKAAAAKGIEYIELPIAYDGLSILVNPKNTWATSLTVEELKKIWQQGSKINNWSQVRNGFPDRPLKLYGPGTASGTFDYFVEEILGKGGKIRSDFTASEDDNVLVQGVSKDVGALGYFGYAYYEENKDKLKVLGVDAGKGPVTPSEETINTGKYAPLSRPLFVYVERKAAERPEVQEFVKFFLTNVKELAKEVGYVPLPDEVYNAVTQRFEKRTTGSVYADESAGGKTLIQLYGGSAGTSAGNAAS